jgi:hypothetical protein
MFRLYYSTGGWGEYVNNKVETEIDVERKAQSSTHQAEFLKGSLNFYKYIQEST